MRIVVGASWAGLVPILSQELQQELHSPFARARILVDSDSSRGLLNQSLALADGISAGIDLLTLTMWEDRLAQSCDRQTEFRAWRGARLVTALLEEFDNTGSAVLRSFLARSGRRFSAAKRFANLFREYSRNAPNLISRWLSSEQSDLPEQFAWQPELLRSTCARLGIDPLALNRDLALAAAADETPTWIFGLRKVAPGELDLLVKSQPRAGFFIGAAPNWSEALAKQPLPEPVFRPAPRLIVAGAHSRLRQAEVLREELTRFFAEDPKLEPREVRIVCPDPDSWGVQLNALLLPKGTHPGRRLRFSPVKALQKHPLFSAVELLLQLPGSRIQVSQMLDLLLHPTMWHWGFAEREERLVELIESAEIRWGFDAGSRRRLGVGEFSGNTWVSGIDALLTGIAMGEEVGPLGVAGIPTTTPTDLELIGSLAEVIGRLWRFCLAAESPTSIVHWCELVQETAQGLLKMPPAEAGQERQLSEALTSLAEAHTESTSKLTATEFRQLLSQVGPSGWRGNQLGNGGIHLVRPSDSPDADRKVSIFLGLTDAQRPELADAIPGVLNQEENEMLTDLLSHARSAQQVLVVTRSASENTGRNVETPVTLDWLSRQLNVNQEFVQYAPQPFNPSAFLTRPSYDETGFSAVLAARKPVDITPRSRLRLEARELPTDSAHSVSVDLRTLRMALSDPVRTFLRNLLGIGWLDSRILTDDIPLVLAGLNRWRATSSFLVGRLAGESPQQLLTTVAARQIAPPGEFGRAQLADAGRRAEKLASATFAARTAPARQLQLQLALGEHRISGSVQLYGDQLVQVDSSSSSRPVLGCWLDLLAVTAAGEDARALLLRPSRDGVFRIQLVPPPPEKAKELLMRYLDAYRIAQSKLLPVPFQPALALVREQATGRFNLIQWVNRLDNRKWSFPDPMWRLFYDALPADLFADPATEIDPSTGHDTSFESWAHWLYAELYAAGGTR